MGVVLRLYDTATREVRELALRDPGTVSIYLCGPTVYGPPHLGHGRATLEYDILRRYLTWCGLDVRLVSNVTDIEDKIIERAEREGRDPAEVAVRCEAVWWNAMDRIGFQRPTDIPHATEWVDEMVEMIGQLLEIGRAYRTDDGVYLSVRSVEDYGLLAQQDLDDMLAGGGEREVVGAEGKRDSADFALWKLAKPGEPCVAVAVGRRAAGLAQRVRRDEPGHPRRGLRPARRRARPQVPAPRERARPGGRPRPALRRALDAPRLRRRPLGREDVQVARQLREPARLHRAARPAGVPADAAAGALPLAGFDGCRAGVGGGAHARRTRRLRPALGVGGGSRAPIPTSLARFRERMDDDLDTPGAMAVVFDTVRRANAAIDAGSVDVAPLVAAVREMTGAVGLELGGVDDVPAEVADRAAALDAARAAKDYAAADAIRAELQADGWIVETTAAGTTVHR